MDESRTWDSLASRYDRIVRVFGKSYPAIRRRLSKDLSGKARVLEIAAGTGQFTLDIATVAEALVATDFAPQMVERLEQVVLRALSLSRGDPHTNSKSAGSYVEVIKPPKTTESV